MTIEERLSLLQEAEQFYSDLSDAWKDTYRLWLRKAAALGTVKDWLELYKTRMLEGKERTDEDLVLWLNVAVDWDFVQKMIDDYGMTTDEADFYMGWFGLAKAIMEGDEETIARFRQEQAAYDELSQQVFWYEHLLSNRD